MAYDPDWPPHEAELTSAGFRVQFTGLKSLVDAVEGGVTGVQVGGVTTGAPGSPAAASVTLAGGVMTFTFTIPEGQAGSPGEVTQAQLSNDLVNMSNYTMNQVLPLTSNNTNWVQTVDITINDPPTQAEVQSLRDKLNELILALRR